MGKGPTSRMPFQGIKIVKLTADMPTDETEFMQHCELGEKDKIKV